MKNPLGNRSGATWKLLEGLLASSRISRDASILALASGPFEQKLFGALGFTNVRFTGFAGGERIDARHLPFKDAEFDVVFIEAALHHLDKPHLCIYEMDRVAKKSVIICETQDNLLSKVLTKAGLIEEYEHSAVRDEGGRTGGMNDGPIPNHVYRWSRGELIKVFRSLHPDVITDCDVSYSWETYGKGGLPAKLVFGLCEALYPAGGNCFAFHYYKGHPRLQPWMEASPTAKGSTVEG